jgi:hypothetical protein
MKKKPKNICLKLLKMSLSLSFFCTSLGCSPQNISSSSISALGTNNSFSPEQQSLINSIQGLKTFESKIAQIESARQNLDQEITQIQTQINLYKTSLASSNISQSYAHVKEYYRQLSALISNAEQLDKIIVDTKNARDYIFQQQSFVSPEGITEGNKALPQLKVSSDFINFVKPHSGRLDQIVTDNSSLTQTLLDQLNASVKDIPSLNFYANNQAQSDAEFGIKANKSNLFGIDFDKISKNNKNKKKKKDDEDIEDELSEVFSAADSAFGVKKTTKKKSSSSSGGLLGDFVDELLEDYNKIVNFDVDDEPIPAWLDKIKDEAEGGKLVNHSVLINLKKRDCDPSAFSCKLSQSVIDGYPSGLKTPLVSPDVREYKILFPATISNSLAKKTPYIAPQMASEAIQAQVKAMPDFLEKQQENAWGLAVTKENKKILNACDSRLKSSDYLNDDAYILRKDCYALIDIPKKSAWKTRLAELIKVNDSRLQTFEKNEAKYALSLAQFRHPITVLAAQVKADRKNLSKTIEFLEEKSLNMQKTLKAGDKFRKKVLNKQKKVICKQETDEELQREGDLFEQGVKVVSGEKSIDQAIKDFGEAKVKQAETFVADTKEEAWKWISNPSLDNNPFAYYAKKELEVFTNNLENGLTFTEKITGEDFSDELVEARNFAEKEAFNYAENGGVYNTVLDATGNKQYKVHNLAAKYGGISKEQQKAAAKEYVYYHYPALEAVEELGRRKGLPSCDDLRKISSNMFDELLEIKKFDNKLQTEIRNLEIVKGTYAEVLEDLDALFASVSRYLTPAAGATGYPGYKYSQLKALADAQTKTLSHNNFIRYNALSSPKKEKEYNVYYAKRLKEIDLAQKTEMEALAAKIAAEAAAVQGISVESAASGLLDVMNPDLGTNLSSTQVATAAQTIVPTLNKTSLNTPVNNPVQLFRPGSNPPNLSGLIKDLKGVIQQKLDSTATGSIPDTAIPAVENLSLPPQLDLTTGDSFDVYLRSAGTSLADSSINWVSTAPNIVEIQGTGQQVKLLAKGAGTAQINVTVGPAKAAIQVTVSN